MDEGVMEKLRAMLLGLPRRQKRLIQVSTDVVVVWAALWLAFVVRLGIDDMVDPLREHLWLFLQEPGVAPTNNHAERMLRFAVLWRKRSLGTASVRGDRWVERILSLRQTCRIQGRRTFPVLADAMTAAFNGQGPDTGWIRG